VLRKKSLFLPFLACNSKSQNGHGEISPVSLFFVDFTCAFYGEKGMVENWIVGMVGVALIVYLFVVLVRPEDF
jgi:K+-transporting ATPase KdpF subunit